MTARELAEWLPRQRWSGLRGERLSADDVRVAASIPLDFADATYVIVDVRAAGGTVRLAVPQRGADDAAAHEAAAHEAAAHDAAAHDATTDAAFRLGLARAIADGRRWSGDGATLVAEPEGQGGALLRDVATSAVGRAEQSNTSLVYDDRVILKLFRRLAPGTQPDVEVTRFLTRRGFPHTPPLLGTLTLQAADGTSVAGMAQRFVAGARDAWAHAVELARAAVLDAAVLDARVEVARRLGETTRALHDALASDAHDPDFAPRPADRAAAARWAAAAARSVEEGVAVLRERLDAGALDALSPDVRDVARRVAAAGADAAVAAVHAAAASAGDDLGAETRHHGDYHLGQVLRAPDGALFVIDFEGEPARPLEERRARHCPLRDVAGMLRSFAYAAATAAQERPDDAAVAAHAGAWERAARTAFLEGYFAAADAAYLPRERAHADALLALFELEKAFYELQYELRNRPSWVPIPLAGIARLTAHSL